MILLVALLTAGSFFIFSRQTDTELLLNVAKDTFYRTPEELSADGVELINLAGDSEKLFHANIRTYYSVEYRKKYESALIGELDTSESGGRTQLLLDALPTSTAVVSAYSIPRKYEDVPNTIGILASASFFNTDIGEFGRNARLFLFTDNVGQPEFIAALPVGEDRATYEAWPIANAKRRMKNNTNPRTTQTEP